jgi:hypothetical protein
MQVLAQAVNATPKSVAAKKASAMQRLRRLAAWGATAAMALLLAVLTSGSEVGSQRIATVLYGGRTQVATPAFDAQAETRRLADAVRDLAVDGDQIKARLTTVEHDMDDVTGSISKQIETANAERRAASEDGPTTSATAAASVALAPVSLAPVSLEPVAARPAVAASPPAPSQSSADAAPPAASASTVYGVDIGSGLTIQALRARWATIRTAHPQLFAGLEPIVRVKEIPYGNRVELRLIVGPIAQAGAATQLCTALTMFGLFCQPTIYDGQHLALR